MADAEQILQHLPQADDVRFWALIPNRKGMERALNVGVKHVATFMSASQTHNRKNLNRTQLESLENIRIVTEMALDEGATVERISQPYLDAHMKVMFRLTPLLN